MCNFGFDDRDDNESDGWAPDDWEPDTGLATPSAELEARYAGAKTPWGIVCGDEVDGGCGFVELDREEYDRQMNRPNSRWRCPKCGCLAGWDDEKYEYLHGRL